ncbi:MAG: AtpZ/AtpI family protein [Peptococcaceae bacterium]|jgi:F0F1-type ATP synthase assembly protein I|nr:AtpZ/AtpI family protein [Peptococcaceae bacterium]
MSNDQQSQRTWIKAVAFGTSIATSLACLVGGGYFLGVYLTKRFGIGPWLKILMMLAGLALGGAYLVRTVKDLLKDKEGDA